MANDDRFEDKTPRAQYRPFKHSFFSKWFSRKAPGTPAGVEFLFDAIEKGEYESAGFKYAQKYYGLTDAEVWEAYEEWKQGRVHPLFMDR